MCVQIQRLMILIIITSTVVGCTKLSSLFVNSGTELTVRLETDKTNRDEVVELAVKIIESRLDAIGLNGDAARVPDTSDQIRVRIYGDQELERVKRFLFTTHQLELKKAVSESNPSPLTTYPTEEAARARVVNGQEVLPYNELGEGSPSQFIIVEQEPIITGVDVRYAHAEPVPGAGDNYTISFSLRKDGAERFSEWTGSNIGNYLAVVLDKSVKSAPFIRGQIRDSGQIDGSFTKASAEEIALSLNSGHLPARLIVVDERPFGN